MKSLARLCLIVVTALALATVTAQAQTDSSSTTNSAPAAKPKPKSKRYTGTIASVDKTGMTVTFSMASGKTHTIHLTSKTRIKKDGDPGTMDDATVGQKVSGSYRINDAGDWVASTLNIGKTKAKPDASTPPASKPAGQ